VPEVAEATVAVRVTFCPGVMLALLAASAVVLPALVMVSWPFATDCW
jgi:hypothetical protein